jgi:hypothetical protein
VSLGRKTGLPRLSIAHWLSDVSDFNTLTDADPTISGLSLLVNLADRASVLSASAGISFFRRGLMMKAYWVIDILKDIRQFSEKNGMVELAEHLDDAIFVAASEIGAKLCGAGTVEVGNGQSRGAAGALADNEVH